MKNRKLILIVSFVLAMTMSLGGTLAYLTDTDADVNTMVLGNVKIVQNEQMRDENGELVEYQNKPALPAVYENYAWDENKVTISGGEFKFFAPEMKNVNDKIVTVTNMGNTSAYVRTIIAIEAPDKNGEFEAFDDELVHVNVNDTQGVTMSNWDYVTTDDGVRYVYAIFTYTEALAAKATSLPSLLQVFLDKETDNEDIGMLGEEWEIIALSQAVQADGFSDANTALNAAFDMDELADWLATAKDNVGSVGGKNDTNNPPYVGVNNAEDLKNAAGSSVVGVIDLTENYYDDENPVVGDSQGELVINLNGNTMDAAYIQNNGVMEVNGEDGTLAVGSAAHYGGISKGAEAVATYNDVNITSAGGGIGAADGAQVTFNSGSVYVDTASTSGRYIFYAEGEGTVITINDGNFSWDPADNQKRAYIYAGAGTTVYVNGGTFGKASTRSGYTAGILGDGTVIITGGTFGFNPTTWVADGYEAVQNGTTWTVQAK